MALTEGAAEIYASPEGLDEVSVCGWAENAIECAAFYPISLLHCAGLQGAITPRGVIYEAL